MKNLLLILLLAGCSKEYSCEDCKEEKDYVTEYSIYVDDNQDLSHIEPEIDTDGFYWAFEIIVKNDTAVSWTYEGSYDLRDYLNLSVIPERRKLPIRYRLVWISKPDSYLYLDTLIK